MRLVETQVLEKWSIIKSLIKNTHNSTVRVKHMIILFDLWCVCVHTCMCVYVCVCVCVCVCVITFHRMCPVSYICINLLVVPLLNIIILRVVI